VARDENLVDLETDKVVLEVPAPAPAYSRRSLGDGTTVTSGQILAVIEEGATAVPGASAPAIMAASGGATSTAAAATGDAAAAATGGKLSPAAKRVAEENRSIPRRLPAPAATAGCRSRM
jgi:2-oxoglutarate dehydrogenase E2 component (dihydrolipoamide succinyltransferase)